MQRFFSLTAPNILLKADKYLLLNFPRLWATRLLSILYYSLIANVLFSLVTYYIVQPYMISSLFDIVMWVVLLGEVGFYLYWLNLQSQFNIEQEFGHTDYFDGMAEILLYTACILAIFSPVLFMSATADLKIIHTLRINPHTDCVYDRAVALLSISEKELEYVETYYQFDGTREIDEILHDAYSKRKLIKDYPQSTLSICRALRILSTGYSVERFVFIYYSTTRVFCILFTLLGILFAVLMKHSNWRIFIIAFVYLVLSFTTIAIIGSIFYSSFPPIPIIDNYFNDSELIAPILLFVVFVITQSVRAIRSKKHIPFAFLNFVSLPIALGVVGFMMGIDIKSRVSPSTSSNEELLISLAIIYLTYILLSPLQKRIFIRLLSLPKE